MRRPDYLSPSSVALFYKDRREFYSKYLCEHRLPRMKQTEPMSVGSAFDAYVKNYLAAGLGMPEADGELKLDYLLETQVEEHNRAFAYAAGLDAFNQYKKLGACAELMKELQNADKVSFEHTVQATVGNEVPLLGKPDLYFWANGELHIYDWKVNGYCSASNTSPNKGYIRLLAAGKPTATHKSAFPTRVNGIMRDATCLGELNTSWADQLSIYGWVLGGVLGSGQLVAGIDQLVFKAGECRVGSYRNTISSAYQDNLWIKCREVWKRIQSVDTVFDVDSAATCLELDQQVAAFVGGSPIEDWYNDMMRSY